MTLAFYHQNTTPPKRSIGEVATRLTQMLDAGYPVPKGFIVSSLTCEAFFAHGRLKDKIGLLLDRCDFHNPADISRVSKTIKKLIMAEEIPMEISSPLLEAAVKLGKERVMLTPSPIGETVVSEKILGLSGEAAILMGIREIWASLFTSDELYSIHASGEFPLTAICVQVEPQASVSGVFITSSEDKASTQIQAVWGEGAYLGKLQGADKYLVTRNNGQEQDKQRSLQTKEVVLSHGKIETKDVPASRQKKQKLESNTLKELAKLAEKIQQDRFFPQEVTFVHDGKKSYIISIKPAVPETPSIASAPAATKTSHILLKGLGMTPGIITGMVRVVKPNAVPTGPGDILVASKLSHLTPEQIRSAKGVIVEEDTPASAVVQLANKGIAFLMSAAGAVDLLEPGAFITLHTPRGEVLAGGYRALAQEEPAAAPRLAMRLGSQVHLGKPMRSLALSHGHLILSPDRLIEDVGTHPMKLVKERKSRQLTDTIARALQTALTNYPESHMLYRFSSLTTNEYRELTGGKQFETVTEENPRMGYFGSTKLLSLPQLAALEIDAVEAVRHETFGKRISLLFNNVRTAFEVTQWQRLLSEKLPRSASLRYFVELGIPSLCWQIDQIAPLVDGVVLDVDQIAGYLFGIDPKNDSFRYQAIDLEPTIGAILNTVEQATRQQGIQLILKGSMLNHDPYLSFAVSRGIHELNLPAKDLPSATQRLVVLEQERVKHV